MSASVEDRRKRAYEEAMTLTDAMLLECFAGGENQIETIVDIEKVIISGPDIVLRVADRPKFVGDDFYQGRVIFPEIKRTMGELNVPTLQFSEAEIRLGNLDGFYNNYLIGGADYVSFIGSTITVKVGLRDVASSFKTIFDGIVPEEGGFEIERESIILRARDSFTDLNKLVPLPTINKTDFPDAPEESVGKIIPMVLGDWEEGYNYTVGAGSVSVDDGVEGTVPVFTDVQENFSGGIIGYNVGLGYFVFSIGTYTPDNIGVCHIKRGDTLIQCNFDTVPSQAAGYWVVLVNSFNKVAGGTLPYVPLTGDIATLGVMVPYDTALYSNPISIAREILYTLGDLTSGDLDTSSWGTLETKSTPAQSSMVDIKARIWIGKPEDTVLGSVLSLLEQVRVELFVDDSQKIKLSSLHFEDWPDPSDQKRVEQFHINEQSVKIKADERNYFNAALGSYAFTPVTNKTQLQTGQYYNSNSLIKTGKYVSKAIDFPNLHIKADVILQLKEFIRLYSAGLEYIDAQVAWTHLLVDLSDFLSFNFNIGSLVFDNKPVMVRDIGFDPNTSSMNFRLLSLSNFAYANYQPSNKDQFLSSYDETIFAYNPFE